MANTHFSGPVLFSAARPTLENLNMVRGRIKLGT
jgi:hypothetical protein